MRNTSRVLTAAAVVVVALAAVLSRSIGGEASLPTGWPAASSGLAAGEDQPGGAATSQHASEHADAFSRFSPNMGFARELDFKIGNALFRKLWVQSPSSTRSSDGLGPLYNARACQACHLKDGRGHPPASADISDRSISMFLRLSVPPSTDEQRQALVAGRINVVGEPIYGTQLQELGVTGHAGEGRMIIRHTNETITLSGGEVVTLRKPTYQIVDLGYGALDKATMLSPRLTPQMIGLGLLEAIPEADIIAREDADDRNGDGISGRANHVWSVEHNRVMRGRFGWKAGQPTVLQQSAEAFAGDIGISNWIVPRPYGDCTERRS